MTRMMIIMASAVALLGLLTWGTLAMLERADQRGYDRATGEMAAKVVIANAATDALEQRQRTQSAAAAASWETQRDALQTQVTGLLSRPGVPIRLCKPASSPSVSRVAPAAGTIDGPAEGRIDAVRMGDDIGGPAVVLAGECERYRLQLKALQQWVSSR